MSPLTIDVRELPCGQLVVVVYLDGEAIDAWTVEPAQIPRPA